MLIKNNDVEISIDLHVFNHLNPKRSFHNAVLISVCLCVCMSSLASERFDGFYSYSVFKSLFNLGRWPVNMNNLAPKLEALYRAPKDKIAIFFKTTVTITLGYQ